jgi:tRNA threonylcarbamoyladenosine biosynthesis protein TsaE
VSGYESLLMAPATAADAAEVQALTRHAFGPYAELEPQPSSLRETVEDVARDLSAHGGLAVRDGTGELVAVSRFSEHDGAFWLRRVAVRPDHRGRGAAAMMLDGAEDEARSRGYDELRVGVRTPLRDVAAYWARRGFRPVAEREYWVELARPVPVVVEVPTAEEMRSLGRRLAGLMRAGDLVVLSGDLGAGKTTLTQGFGAGLGVRGPVTSPTFVIARVHPPLRGDLPLVHVDAYRLADLAEVDDLDLDASLEESVTVVEWGEGLVEGLADDRVEVVVRRSPSPDDETRRVLVTGVGARWRGAGLAAAVSG